jgi:hypothetical protein
MLHSEAVAGISKSEYRNPKEIRISKIQMTKTLGVFLGSLVLNI